MAFRGVNFDDEANGMSHSLKNVLAFSTTQKQATPVSQEGLLLHNKNGYLDRRTKINFKREEFRLRSYTTLCQMKVVKGTGKECVGSCSSLKLLGKNYIFTCAHNLVSWSTLEERYYNIYAGSVYTMRQGVNKWAHLNKILVNGILVHPKFNGEPYSGFDIGIAPIVPVHHKYSRGRNFTRTNDVAWGAVHPESIEVGLDIEVAGFPGEKKGYAYVHHGKIIDKKQTKQGGWLIFYNVDTTPGNSGSDINVIDKEWVQNWHRKRNCPCDKNIKKMCIGVHTGHDDVSELNYGTLTTPAIVDWFNRKIKEKNVVV